MASLQFWIPDTVLLEAEALSDIPLNVLKTAVGVLLVLLLDAFLLELEVD